MKKLIINYLFVFYLVSSITISCSNDLLYGSFSQEEQCIESAKALHDANLGAYYFCQTEKQTKSSQDRKLNFDWSKTLTVDRENAFAVEVSLYDTKDRDLYVEQSILDKPYIDGKFESTTRLIVRYCKIKKKYEQFIITKIWLDKKPIDIENVSFNELSKNTITLIYNINGAFISRFTYDKKGITPIKSNNGSLHKFKLSQEPIETRRIATKSGGGLYYCRYCDKYLPTFRCPICKSSLDLFIPDIDVINPEIYVLKALGVLSGALERAMYMHSSKCTSLCYGSSVNYTASEYVDLLNMFNRILIYELYSNTGNTFNPQHISTAEIHNIFYKYPTSAFEAIIDRNYDAILKAAEQACLNACANNPHSSGGGGTTSGGTTGGGEEENPNPPEGGLCDCKKCNICDCCIKPKTNCRRCECNIAILDIGSKSVELLQKYTIVVKCETSVLPMTSVVIRMKRTRTSNYTDIATIDLYHPYNLTTFERVAITAGTLNIQAKAYFGNKQDSSLTNVITVEEISPCHTSIYKDQSVQMEFIRLWESTKEFARQHKSDMLVQEYGCWVCINTKSQKYEFSTENITQYQVKLIGNVTANIGFEERNEVRPSTPLETTLYTVAAFHTHYPVTWSVAGSSRTGGPELSDINSANLFKLPCFVYDYVGYIDSGHHIDKKLSKVYEFGGYSRRPLPI